MGRLASNDIESGRTSPAPPFRPATSPGDDVIEIPHRNPWLMRIHLNFPTIPFPSIFSRKHKAAHADNPSQVSLNNFTSQQSQSGPPIRTRVWSDEENRTHKSPEQHNSVDVTSDARSISSAQGVFVETHLVHESQPSGGQR